LASILASTSLERLMPFFKQISFQFSSSATPTRHLIQVQGLILMPLIFATYTGLSKKMDGI